MEKKLLFSTGLLATSKEVNTLGEPRLECTTAKCVENSSKTPCSPAFLMPITLNNLKDGIGTATAKSDEPLLQNVWQEYEYCLDVCRVTNGAYIKLS
jgi:hypothetical protein